MVTQAPEPPPYADLIEYIARALAEKQDEVAVSEEWDEDHCTVRLRVSEDDMGRVIGRAGRVAQAMRTLLRVAAIRSGDRATLEIVESD
ncbi:MAG TPA: KH domain-containing protein [Dehalococcoidia bacterium]|nr:KH domain-containing protein [Dehalococcoidia bacterium]